MCICYLLMCSPAYYIDCHHTGIKVKEALMHPTHSWHPNMGLFKPLQKSSAILNQNIGNEIYYD